MLKSTHEASRRRLLISNVLSAQKSRALEAEQWFQRATELAPNDPTVFKHFGKTENKL
jgi:hypothetical protein